MKKEFIYLIIISAFLFTGCLTTAPVSEINTSPDSESGKGFILDDKTVYEYNSEGLRIKRYDYNKNNQLKEVTEYIYENNILTGKKFYDGNENYDGYENYQYDSEGRKIKETEYKADGTVKNYKIFEYKENSSYTKKYFKADGSFYRFVEKIFDENGNLLEETNNEAEFYHYK